jgi:hypothetical protein
LEEAHRGVATQSPPFLFLHPDHIHALLAQTFLLRPADATKAEEAALELIQGSDTGSWSQAVAASILLSLHFREALESSPHHAITPTAPHERRLLRTLAEAAEFEQDPLLSTEYQIQRLSRIYVAGADLTRSTAVEKIALLLNDAPAPTVLLRSVELSILWALSTPTKASSNSAFSRVREQGMAVLVSLRERLSAYDADESLQSWWQGWLESVSGDSCRTAAASWVGEEMMRLRAIAWP